MIRAWSRAVGCGLAVWLAGCGPTGVKEQDIEVKASNDPLNEPRSVLKRYADGQPLGSEVTTFPYMVEQVKKADPQRGEVLEKGLADIQKSPAERSAKAKELLKKLAPSMGISNDNP